MKKVSRRDLFTLAVVAPVMAAMGKPIKPKPKFPKGRFYAFFKYYLNATPYPYRQVIFFKRQKDFESQVQKHIKP